MQFRYFEDFEIGEVIELGSHPPLTQQEIIEFARQFDPQPFHTDPEKAKDSMFGTLVASGWHTASLYMRLLVDGLASHAASWGSPGLDELRWHKPLYPGDSLRGRFTVLELTPSRSKPMGIVKGRAEALNQNDEVIMSFISIGFFGRRPQS